MGTVERKLTARFLLFCALSFAPAAAPKMAPSTPDHDFSPGGWAKDMQESDLFFFSGIPLEDYIQVNALLGKDVYTALYSCSNFSNAFHYACYNEKLSCRSVTAFCPGSVGHAFNMVQILDLWFLVEPQGHGIVVPGFPDPNNPNVGALCALMDVPLDPKGGCKCKLKQNSATPLPTVTNPHSCATSQEPKNWDTCEGCCHKFYRYEIFHSIPETQKAFSMCYNACRNHYRMNNPDTSNLTQPLTNDHPTIAFGRQCVAKSTIWSIIITRLEQCQGCCLDGAVANDYHRAHLPSCMAVCNAEYR